MATGEAEMFASMVRGRSDDEIYGLADMAGGSAALLGQLLEAMRNAVDIENAPDTRLGFRIDDKGTAHAYTIAVAGKQATVDQGTDGALVTIITSLPDFVRLLARELDWGEAFNTARVTAEGDLSLLMQLGTLFRQPAA